MGQYITAVGIWYANELPTIRKKKDTPLQPIFEAFTNAWEAIIEKYTIEHLRNGHLTVDIYLRRNLHSNENHTYDFDKIVVTDNGIGLNDKSYGRLVNLRDNSKGVLNKGTGRIQYIHFFDDTIIESVYKSSENSTYKKRKITLSKKEAFLKENAILRLDEDSIVDAEDSYTIVTFRNPIEAKETEFYQTITSYDVKKALIEHFLSKFCDNRQCLPQITIHKCVDDEAIESLNIVSEDVPQPDKEDSVIVHYSKLDERRKIVSVPDKEEDFKLRAFVHSEELLPENVIYLVSNGATGAKIHLDNISKTDNVDGKRYMFLLSGNYIDNNDRDDRGNINLISATQFKKQQENILFPEEVVLLDDIEVETNKKIGEIYQEIAEKNKVKLRNIEDLKRMFLLNPQTVDTLKNRIKNTDTDEQILQKIYESDAKIKAQQDAEIKQQVDNISALMPIDADYQERLKEHIDEFVRTIPLQNRTALSQYVARRKLVLDIFEKILDRELERLRNGERINEDILHNLIFQQHANNTEDSDLWLINEEYIYFSGVSEHRFIDIEYKGRKIFKDDLPEDEVRYLNSLGEKRLHKRPDVLLFPEEEKCIIIEFKAPDVNVSEHLSQIDFYANLLRNYTIDELQITSFYGYLIGESIEDRDVRGRVSRFEYSPKFNYWFRPSEKVVDFSNRNDGNIYMEIIKYSSLLQRAKLRNKIFIEKLEKGNNP